MMKKGVFMNKFAINKINGKYIYAKYINYNPSIIYFKRKEFFISRNFELIQIVFFSPNIIILEII
jgi:hypothetical protein